MAMPVLPITGAPIYGSNDGGMTVTASNQVFNDQMKRLAVELHIVSHNVMGKVLHSAGFVLVRCLSNEPHAFLIHIHTHLLLVFRW